jgi:integrase/recombinase XerD
MNAFATFIRERRYLHNVSDSTVSWYTHALKWLPSESPTQAELKEMVMRMRSQGLKETGCNSAIRACNAYLKWNGSGFKIPQLKEPQKILPTFSDPQVKLIVNWKPKHRNFYQRRLHLLALLLLDTGCRITEALTLHVRDVDMNNMLVTFDGKGRKQRTVPFSFPLRKVLYRFIADFERTPDSLLFATKQETAIRRVTALRSVKLLCETLGFEAPPRTLHACRHYFATTYIRRGGSPLYLQRILGHSTLTMSQRYVGLVVSDLQAVHPRLSPLMSATTAH